jgi:hypothetical protein
MTQEQKTLLLKDLCSRLSYGVKCAVHNDTNIYRLSGVVYGKPYSKLYFEELDWKECDGFEGIQYCKPYLFPMSSMTEDQKYEFYLKFIAKDCDFYYFKFYLDDGKWHKLPISLNAIEAIIDWFHKNHIDYRGLIEKGLAVDATGKNIY